jgi:NADH:ubiquinone oxidoreductase subunit 4 (subunit M)
MSAYADSLVPTASPYVALDRIPLVLLLGSFVAAFFGDRFDPRKRHAVALVSIGMAIGLLAVHIAQLFSLQPTQRALRDVTTNLVRLGSFDANLGFLLQPTTAFLLLLPFIGSAFFLAKVKFGKKNHDPIARFHASVLLLNAGVSIAVMADGFVALALGLSLSIIATYLLVVRDERLDDSRTTAGRVFVFQNFGLAALLFGFVTLFWHLGGAFRADGYLPDYQARFIAAYGKDHVRDSNDVVVPGARVDGERDVDAISQRAKGRGSLTFTSHPGARVYVDAGDKGLERAEVFATSPFIRKDISTGPHEVTIVAGGSAIITGDGQEVAWIERLVVGPDENVSIVPLGQTTTFSELDDQLELVDEDGKHFVANALFRRSLFGQLDVVSLVVFLATLGALCFVLPVLLVPWFGKNSSAPTWNVLRISAVVLALIPLVRLHALVTFHLGLVVTLVVIAGLLALLLRTRKPALILGAATFSLLMTTGLASAQAEESRIQLRPEFGETIELTYSPDGETMLGAFVIRNEGSSPVEVTGARLRGNESWRHSPPFMTVEIEGAKGAPVTIDPGKQKRVVLRWRYGSARAREFFGQVFVDSNATSFPSMLAVHGSRPRDLGPFGDRALSFVIAFPLVAALLALILRLLRRNDSRLFGGATALVYAIHLAFVLVIAARFDSQFKRADGNEGLQFIERTVWLGNSGVEWYLGIDGISLIFVIITSIAALVASLASLSADNRVFGFHLLAPMIVSSLMGVFLAQDLFLLSGFWIVAALTMTLLIVDRAGREGGRGALGFGAVALAGAVFLGASGLWLHKHSDPTYLVDGRFVVHSWSLADLARVEWIHSAKTLYEPTGFLLAWSALFVSFFSSLMTVGRLFAFLDAPANMVVPVGWSAMALYGLLRLEVSVLPIGMKWASLTIILLGLSMLIVFAFLARKQTSWRFSAGHLTTAHAGIALIGIGACTPQGLASVVHVFVSLTVTILLFALLNETLARHSLSSALGLATKMPIWATLFLIASFVAIGLPLTAGFWGPLLAVVGVFPRHPWVAFLTVFALVFLGATALRQVAAIVFGSAKEKSSLKEATDLGQLDLVTLGLPILLALGLGLAPRTLFSLLDAVILDLHRLVDAAGSLQVG